MQAANRVAKNTMILYIKMAINVFISLYTTRLVLHALGAEDFGLYNVIYGIILMLNFINASMTAASQRFISFSMGEGNITSINKIFNMSVILHLRIVIVIFIVLEVTGYFIFNGILNVDPSKLDTAKLIYQFMVITMLVNVIHVPYDALLNAHENMLFFAIIGLTESIFKLSIAIFITYVIGNKLIYFGALSAISSILILLMYRIYCHKKYPEAKIQLKATYDKPLLKEMTGFAGWSFLGLSSSMIATYGQGIVLNMFFGTLINAAQGIATQVSGQLGAFATTMMQALNPIIAKSEGEGNRVLMVKAAKMGSKISFFLLMFFYIPVIIEMPYIFRLWLNNIPEFAILFCQLLLFRNLIEQPFLTLASSIAAVGKIRNYQIFSSILWSLPLIASYFLFKFGYPPFFLYISFIVYSILAGILILFFSKINYHLKISAFLNDVVFKCFAAFIVTLLISYLPAYFLNEGFIRLIITSVISLISFSLTVWYIGFSYEERNKLLLILKPWINKFLLYVKVKAITEK